MSSEDHARVTEAIRSAEEKTAGEIYCVVARSSDSYFFPAAFMLALAMLAVGLVVAFLLEYWWYDLRMHVFVAAQIAGLRLRAAGDFAVSAAARSGWCRGG